MATTYGISKEQYQQLLKEYKNMSLKKKVAIIREGNEIDIKYGFNKKSHSQKRKWRKDNAHTLYQTFTI